MNGLQIALAFIALATTQASSQVQAPSSTADQPPPQSSSADQQAHQIRLGNAIQAPTPAIPKSLYGKTAAAVIGATIATDGQFTDLSALAGNQDLEYAALDAVHQWRYTPTTLNGNPVEGKVFITFALKEGAITTAIESDLPFPDGPKRPMQELYSSGELFAVDPKQMQVPKPVFDPDPEYTQAARVAKRQGTVVLGMILGRDGIPEDLWVIRKFVSANGEQKTFKPIGLGIEQKALETVRHWKFQPAVKDGKPVPVFLNIEVQFRLY